MPCPYVTAIFPTPHQRLPGASLCIWQTGCVWLNTAAGLTAGGFAWGQDDCDSAPDDLQRQVIGTVRERVNAGLTGIQGLKTLKQFVCFAQPDITGATAYSRDGLLRTPVQ